jgi:hypothetical protein
MGKEPSTIAGAVTVTDDAAVISKRTVCPTADDGILATRKKTVGMVSGCDPQVSVHRPSATTVGACMDVISQSVPMVNTPSLFASRYNSSPTLATGAVPVKVACRPEKVTVPSSGVRVSFSTATVEVAVTDSGYTERPVTCR